jgi:hypothetical protein
MIWPTVDRVGLVPMARSDRYGRVTEHSCAKQVKNGAKIYDIGLDAVRAGRAGAFFKAEVAFMEGLGYKRQFARLVDIDGKTYRVYEWVRSSR